MGSTPSPAVSDTEHPPAGGTALGIAISGYSTGAGIAVVTGLVVLSTPHNFLKPHLRCLPWKTSSVSGSHGIPKSKAFTNRRRDVVRCVRPDLRRLR